MIEISFFDSAVSNLDVANNASLKYFDYEVLEELEVLDLSRNPNLERITAQSGITDIEVLITDSLSKLTTISLPGHESLRFVDVSDNINLENLELVLSSIAMLDISNNGVLTNLQVQETPNLTCIQVSQEQFDDIPAGWQKDTGDVYSTDCGY